MSYLVQYRLAESNLLRCRVTACAASLGVEDPEGFAYVNRWRFATSLEWVEAWKRAEEGDDGETVEDGVSEPVEDGSEGESEDSPEGGSESDSESDSGNDSGSDSEGEADYSDAITDEMILAAVQPIVQQQNTPQPLGFALQATASEGVV